MLVEVAHGWIHPRQPVENKQNQFRTNMDQQVISSSQIAAQKEKKNRPRENQQEPYMQTSTQLAHHKSMGGKPEIMGSRRHSSNNVIGACTWNILSFMQCITSTLLTSIMLPPAAQHQHDLKYFLLWKIFGYTRKSSILSQLGMSPMKINFISLYILWLLFPLETQLASGSTMSNCFPTNWLFDIRAPRKLVRGGQ